MKYRNSAEVIPAELLEEIQDKSTTEYPQNSILDEIKGNRWIDVVRDVFKGYNSISKLTKEEKDAVPYVMMSVEYLFAAWFVSQNDVKCCENSLGIMRFVRDNIDKIRFALRGF